MHIGIIVYSLSGHTLRVAKKLKDRLAASGHRITLDRIEVDGPTTLQAESGVLKTVPPVDAYDAIVLGSPVRGGTPPPPVKSYLNQIGSLQGKKMALLVTGIFPAGWGRNQTLSELTGILESKGATVCGSGSVGWISLNRKRQIAAAIGSLVGSLREASN
ncbi:MAG: NAD(P)H-dependent oxidoreductase [Anaerolineales bacterium]|nr:NAD(P)H-dependent oxidoreductase [Anaerolineales bacterium]